MGTIWSMDTTGFVQRAHGAAVRAGCPPRAATALASQLALRPETVPAHSRAKVADTYLRSLTPNLPSAVAARLATATGAPATQHAALVRFVRQRLGVNDIEYASTHPYFRLHIDAISATLEHDYRDVLTVALEPAH